MFCISFQSNAKELELDTNWKRKFGKEKVTQ